MRNEIVTVEKQTSRSNLCLIGDFQVIRWHGMQEHSLLYQLQRAFNIARRLALVQKQVQFFGPCRVIKGRTQGTFSRM
jgi:hypothetical protein